MAVIPRRNDEKVMQFFFFFFLGGGGRGQMKCIIGDVLVAYAVADPGEGPATPSPLSFRPN